MQYKPFKKLENSHAHKILSNVEIILHECSAYTGEEESECGHGITTREILRLLSDKRLSSDGKRIINNYGLPLIQKLAMMLRRDARFIGYKSSPSATTQWSIMR